MDDDKVVPLQAARDGGQGVPDGPPNSMTKGDLPDVKMTANGQTFRQHQPLTMPNVRKVLQRMKVELKYDVMRNEIAFCYDGRPVPPEQHGLVIETLSDTLVKLDINNLNRLHSILLELARMQAFHPFEQWLMSLPKWDRQDHIGALCDSLRTQTPQWDVYVEKWLIQACEAACGWHARKPRQLSAVLVLGGGQGIGKSTWLEELFPPGMDLFLDGAQLRLDSNSHAKDDMLAVLGHLAAELGEIETTFHRSGIGATKNFISSKEDKIRAPYARRAEKQLRNTVFCGSVNEMEFLMDPSGSRRFWPIWVESIDWSYEVPHAQLWAQVYAMWKTGEPRELTAEEEAQRAVDAAEHQSETPLQERVDSYFAEQEAEDFKLEPALQVMNVSLFMEKVFGIPAHRLSPSQKREITATLTARFGKRHSRKDGVKRSWVLPIHRWLDERKIVCYAPLKK